MIGFTRLYTALDQTNSTNAKVRAMADYFAGAEAADAAWAVYFLTGRRLKRLVKRAELRAWALETTDTPEWLLEESYQHVGDMAETIALLLPEPEPGDVNTLSLAGWVEERLLRLPMLDESERAVQVLNWWRQLPNDASFALNKLMTGALRVGVSQRLVVRALALHFQLDAAVITHRLMGQWTPAAAWFRGLGDPDTAAVSASTPYPFFLASPLERNPAAELGNRDDWQAEWKWDGIRAQLIRRGGQLFIWSRGEELLEGRFPEIEAAAAELPDGVVLDGEILAWADGAPLPFTDLQRRIGNLTPGSRLLKTAPVVMLAYDLLEFDAVDWRPRALRERRERLEAMLENRAGALRLSDPLPATDWHGLRELREESRARGVEGLMLKRSSSAYGVGRQRGDWWKWKIEPLTLDAVLLYAQPGSGRRSGLLTDYTFAVWAGERGNSELVPVCKAYSGLSNDEIAELDRWIRQHTKERFGPVRSVEAQRVFEIAFEGIQLSKRHKSGVALRFPRIFRRRPDLGIAQADTLESVRALLAV